MFETEYREVFSQITASEETHRRILTMKNEKRKTHGAAIASKLLIAAVMLSLLAVTASATGLTGWFAGFFAEVGGEPLSQGQTAYIEENTQDVGLAQTVEGYTISLKSAITDGCKTYICLGVTAPEGVDLGQAPQAGYTLQTVYPSMDIRSADGSYVVRSYATYWREDNDGKANTMDIAMMMESYDDGLPQDVQWQLSITNLTADCWNTAYEQELQAKYAGLENVMYTDEEAETLNVHVPLVEGDWNFTFRLENDSQSRELLTAPITVQASTGWDANGQDVLGDVAVTSIVLRELSATVSYTGEYADLSYGDRVRAVRKDGTMVTLWSDGGAAGEMYLFSETPMVLEEVDHLLLPDGTKLPVS